ncbi:hypothetical protein, variant 2 [Aphanomyces invadans]|uniref:FYVE-type domain-containing protein n=1 Tax=Aphanomyces invadans TaxID=157072 RepID=A0A024TTL3_9STRA|nr:hypothetical protein H310_09803 [Aphanomyces invadans]XP_008874188.1 hypothetical protein, variant 1 [Aphanomyces invadans]XP_008874189.1 hypothetical protein, variant 2 [Aphanomyces invadans]ETV96941.1 hypothetical protein H310_09803 [Aphanomyces invadans]ETV96942.1 hypothetical protein, variant 1 [Aphanomyces invadans]ETV96943.1 hypothetical protein, variant 2 [Aphanomyces invadans]|eukprot:XP_008874187.1 hypothetical protein H310_09803 [Aphanomyces invadans]
MRHMHVFNEEDLVGIDILRGIPVDVWKPDPQCDRCNACVKKFRTLYRRKHHCRVCGEIYCFKCLQLRYVRIPWVGVALTTVCVWCCEQQAASQHPKSSSSGACLRQKPMSPLGSSITASSFQHGDRDHHHHPLQSTQSSLCHERQTRRRSTGLQVVLDGSVSLPPAMTTAPAISPISVLSTPATARAGRQPDQLDHTLNRLCLATQCSYGVILQRSGTSFRILAQRGSPHNPAGKDSSALLRLFLAEPRPTCWNPLIDQAHFCGAAPLVDMAIGEHVGCVGVMDLKPRNPASFAYLRGVLHDHARIAMDQLKQLQHQNLSKKLISIRSRNHSAVSSAGANPLTQVPTGNTTRRY